MPALLFDVSHTSHTRARTGVQRVVRSLLRELGEGALPVTHDPHQGVWRPLDDWERANLAAETPGAKRGARWPLSARLRGRWRRWTGATPILPAETAGFLTAEIFSPAVGAQLPAAIPRVAIFHDAIALRYPELSPAGTVTRFPAYLTELLRFDGVAAVSADSRDALVDYWRWAGATRKPPVVAIPLGVDPVRTAAAGTPPATPVVLSVGTLEGRKNHVALLEACGRLWAGGAKFTLRLAGGVQAETGRQAHERLRALQAAGRPIRYDGALTDEQLAAAYAECAFTVYPSIAEGFGLPVIESLAHGRPCVCSGRGAVGEQSRAGGCVPLEAVDAGALAGAIGRLLDSPAELAQLTAAARARTFRSWTEYTRELVDWVATLRRRPV